MFDIATTTLMAAEHLPRLTLSGDGSLGPHAKEPRTIDVRIGMNTVGNTTSRTQPGSAVFAIGQRMLDGRTTVLSVEGELDLASAPSLKWALTDLLDAGVSQLIVDLSHVSFVDSTALGVLVGIHMSLNDDAHLAIVCGDANVLKIFELTGLDGTFDIFSTLEGALAHPRGRAPATG
jgi:anti-sigma B factor antagonist